MSELAFNLNGEPFELPSAAVGWRVRKMKPKGAPEVVYSRDGIPLILPIDADIDDLRRAARSEGRFRLDPVDEHNRMIANASAGYVCVPADESPPEPVPAASRVQTDNVAIEAMKLNTELARSIIDKFPLMIESAAVLLRAADSAGITTRPPRVLTDQVVEDGDEEDDEDEDDDDQEATPDNEAAPKASGLVGLIETLAPFVMPAIVNAIAGGKLKIPGGIGALLDCRRARPKARPHAEASTSHATSTPGAGPAPGPRGPAPDRAGTTSTPTAGRRAPASGSGFAHAHSHSAGAHAGTAVHRRPAAAAPAPSSPAASPRAPISPPPSAPPTGHPAADRPVSDATTATFATAAAPAVAAPRTTASIHPHDLRSAARTGGQASETPAEQLPDAGALASHVTHRNEAPVELDLSADGRLHVIPGADRPDSGTEPADEANDDANDEGVTPADDEPTGSDAETEDELPTLDAATLAHFVAIQGALTFREGMLARALAAELSPAELRTWMTELRQLSVADAAARIRDVLGETTTDDAAGGGS